MNVKLALDRRFWAPLNVKMVNPGIDCVGCIWPQDGVDFRCFGRIQQLNNVGIDSSRLRASKRRFQALAGQGLGSLLGPTERRRIPPFWPHPAAKQRRNRQSKAHGVQTSVSGTRTRGTGTAFGAQQPRGFSSTRSALSIHLLSQKLSFVHSALSSLIFEAIFRRI